MKSRLLSAVHIFILITYCQSNAVSASALYAYVGNNYDTILGTGTVYNMTMSVQGTLELTSLLAPNLNNSSVAPLSFNFSDGLNSFTNINSGAMIFNFSTDSLGNIIEWNINLNLPFPSPTSSGDTRPILTTRNDSVLVRDQAQELTCSSASAGVCTGVTSFDIARIEGDPGNWMVSAVPVPAALWLFGSGLFGLIGIARRKKA